MALSSCPECGQSLDGMSAEEVKGHRDSHWAVELDATQPRSKEAKERMTALEDEYEDRRAAERKAAQSPRPRSAD